jgi:D-sedoheptulose 7-phosphate isomerase
MSGSSALQRIQAHFEEGARLRQQTAKECADAITRAATAIAAAFRSGGKLLLCGNGGSAADSQHIAAEFVSILDPKKPRGALPAIALTTDTSFLTANANDFGFVNVFARQVEGLGKPGDVLLAITTSGNSENVLAALKQARGAKLKTIVLTGRSGGSAASLADIAIKVPADSTQLIQEVHIAIGHLICELVEREVSGER